MMTVQICRSVLISDVNKTLPSGTKTKTKTFSEKNAYNISYKILNDELWYRLIQIILKRGHKTVDIIKSNIATKCFVFDLFF